LGAILTSTLLTILDLEVLVYETEQLASLQPKMDMKSEAEVREENQLYILLRFEIDLTWLCVCFFIRIWKHSQLHTATFFGCTDLIPAGKLA
jgi:hypothetical protein